MVRKFLQSDTDSVMNVWLKGCLDAHDFIDQGYWKNAYDKVKDEYLSQSDTYVYLKDDRIVGFIGILSDDTVGALFIQKEYQHQGIGTHLLDYAKAKYASLSVSVYQKNFSAVSFYKKNQFEYAYTQTDLNTNEKEDVYLYSR